VVKEITCNQTRVVTTHRVMSADLNEHETMFGGKLLAMVDAEASLAAVRLTKGTVVTASMDHVQFAKPFVLGDAAELQAYVTGIGKRSIEVFAKVIDEEMATGKRSLGFTCFMTYVAIDEAADFSDYRLVGEDSEQVFLMETYVNRRARRTEERQNMKMVRDHISFRK
jgi:acyl-CoA hydrolase